MKKKFYILVAVLFLFTTLLKAQAPNSFNYQGVARDASGVVLPNQSIRLRFSVHQAAPAGTIVYQETQLTTTNQLGLFTVSLGSGTVVTGTIATVAWGSNAEYLQVEMDPTGGTTYLDMGTNQFLSVPYALSSGSSSADWNLKGNAGLTNPAAPATYGSTNFGSTENWMGTTDTKDFTLGTNKIERMRIGGGTVATAGFVGIGTSTPGAPIHLNQNGNQASDFGPANTGYNTAVEIENKGGTMPILYINGSTANNQETGILHRGTTKAFFEGTNGNTDFRIAGVTAINSTAVSNAKDGSAGLTVLNANGNVGIGTIAPSQMLHIVNTANMANDFGTAQGYNLPLEIQSTAGAAFIYLTSNNNATGIIERGNIGSTTNAMYTGLNNTQDYRIAGIASLSVPAVSNAKDGSAGLTVLASNGNVGIQKIAPAQALDVAGNIQLSGAFMPGGAAGTAGQVLQSNGTGTAPTWVAASGGGGGWSLTGNGSTTPGTNYIGTSDGKDLVFKTTATERMRMLSGGNIGIGTTTPSQMLHIVNTANMANDFGTAQGYNFPLEIQSTAGAAFVYLTSNNNATGIIERGNIGSTTNAMYTGLNNSQDYRIAGIASLSVPAVSAAKDGSAGLTVLASSGNVGIQKIAPAQALDVAGNIQLSGAFMPGGVAGTTGQVLQSNGTGAAPTWVPAPTTSGTAGGVNYGTGTGSAFTTVGVSGQVLVSSGSSAPTWQNVTAIGGTGDNWGAQTVVTNATLTGNGVSGTPLGIAQQGATTGQVLSWSGTAWAPATAAVSGWSLTGNGSTTPGTNFIGTTDAKDFVLKTGGTERMRWLSGGNIGIGTTTPSQMLHIVNTVNMANDFGTAQGYNFPLEIQSTAGAAFVYLTSNNNATGIIERGNIGSTTNAMYTGLNNTQDYRIAGIASLSVPAVSAAKDGSAGITVLNSNGNVGIGITTPGTPLHVVTNGNLSSDFGSAGGYNPVIEIENKSGTEPILYINGSTSNNSLAGIVQRGGSTAIYEGLNNNKDMRIAGMATITSAAITSAKDGSAGLTVSNSSGNVGIQNASPAQALDVTGNVKFSQALMPNNNAGTAGQILQSNGANVPPTWVPAPTTSGTAGGVNYGTGTGSAFTSVGVSGQVLQSNGAGAPTWVNVTALGATGDNWGAQTVVTNSTLSGNGVSGTPLTIAQQGATSGQVLTWNGTTWAPAAGGSGWGLTGNAGTNPGTNFIGTTDGKDLVFKTNSTENARISSSNGYFGIGTTSPNAALHVVENGNQPSDFNSYPTAMEIENPNGTMPILYINGSTANNALAAVIMRGSGTAMYAGLNNNQDFRIAGVADISDNSVSNAKDGNAGLTVLNSNGNVGIGTFTPSQLLDVVDVNNTGSDFGGYNFQIEAESPGGTNAGIYINGSTSNNGMAGVVESGFSNAFYSGLNGNEDYRIAGLPDISEGSLSSAKDGVAGITVVNSNGNVGINTNTPDATLQVSSGNVSMPINVLSGSGTINLGSSPLNYTVVLTAAPNVTLPTASSANTGVIYILVNGTASAGTISSYVPHGTSTGSTVFPASVTIQVQSNGTKWYQIN